jgi:hypothetical protein
LLYEDLPKPTESEALDAFKSGSPDAIAESILGLALYGEDPKFAEAWCLFFLGHTEETISRAAAIAIGHLARRTKSVSRTTVLPALEIVKAQGRIVAAIEDALDDISVFCGIRPAEDALEGQR